MWQKNCGRSAELHLPFFVLDVCKKKGELLEIPIGECELFRMLFTDDKYFCGRLNLHILHVSESRWRI